MPGLVGRGMGGRILAGMAARCRRPVDRPGELPARSRPSSRSQRPSRAQASWQLHASLTIGCATPASAADRVEFTQSGKRSMRTAIITPGPPGVRRRFLRPAREGGIGGWRCRDPCTAGADAVAVHGPGGATQHNGLSGCLWLPGWLPVADRLCGTDLDHSSTWSARTRTASACRYFGSNDCLRAVPQ